MTTAAPEAAPELALARASSRPAVVSACLLMLVALVDSQVLGALTPQVAAGLRSAPERVAASVTIYAVAAATVALLLGRYARRAEPARWLPRAGLLFVVANAAAAFAPRLAVFWAARALAGFAGGLVSALAIAALANASSYERRGRQMSGVAISYFLAPVLGVPAGTWLAGRFGWRVVFGATAVLVGLAGLLVRQFPLRGAIATADANTADEATRTESVTAAHDSRAGLWRLAWRSGATRRGIVSAFFVSGGLVGLTTYLGAWLADAFHEGPREVGAIYAVAGLGAVVGGAAGGALADRYGKRRVAVASSVAMAALLLVLPTFNHGAALWTIIGLTAFAAALRIAPLQALITELVAPSERATYVALRNGMSQLGIAVAVAVGARLYPRMGLMGVALWCAVLTLGAWLALRALREPGLDESVAVGHAADVGTKSAAAGAARGRRRRVVRKLAYAVVVLVVVLVVGFPWLLSFAVTKAGTRPDERRRTDTPAVAGVPYEDVTFDTADGNRLSGWYLPARTHAVNVVMTHGLFRSRYELLERGVELWRAGYGVLLYDLRRHGRSTGEFSTVGYDERRDVAAAVGFVRARAPGQKIVLMGVSMGAAATLLAAAEEQPAADIVGVVAESSFLSLADTVRQHVALFITPRTGLPVAPLSFALTHLTAWRMNFRAADFDVARAVRRVRQPVLFIGGGRDVRMPNETVLAPLYAAAPNPQKRQLIIPDAPHGRAFDTDPAQYMAAVLQFISAVEASGP
ncbi:MAG TPA: MFS transporter [Pyrinomonadaceae bacterium]|jgi:predicted MFS family arabinose efflux permease/alpha-beta hydrolase superfamily lysophospholipase